ncbi:MAG: hypothetical protein IPK07_00065 [Deltaproteobacteria bacterium]|nr:hypothetical protein [Deltaproteobacteria bacterium]
MAAARALGIPRAAVRGVTLVRRSLDARTRPPRWVVTVDAEVEGEDAVLEAARHPNVARAPAPPAPFAIGRRRGDVQPVVIGAGPAGLFAVMTFLEAGVVPRVVERGHPVERRSRDVARFFRGGAFDPESNIQFGEGGAGTFSDGKLYTRRRDADLELVLRRFVEFGAPSEILTDGRPHIGTDRLRDVLRNLRATFHEAGVVLGFGERAERFEVSAGRLEELVLSDGSVLRPHATLLATGHSARDTFAELARAGVALEAKPFAIGVRVEHPQWCVDVARYGARRETRGAGLPPADYNLTAEAAGRGVYTFCMCPGGRILAATSEAGAVVTNGMSAHSRAAPRANSGVVVSLEASDFGGASDPLAGVAFQRRWEEAAFALGGGDYHAPAQRLVDFLAGRPSEDPLRSSYRPGVTPTALDGCLPGWVIEPLREGLRRFGAQMPGFVNDEAVLVGVETRTSSPIRIPRTGGGEALGTAGLFPAGEGAGYAGGITTAALDGVRAARHALAALGLA